MSFLTITDGTTTVIVDVSTEGGATERESRRVGETVDTGDGTLATSVSAEFREWEFPAAMMPPADYEVLRALVALDVRVTVSGTAIDYTGATSLTCVVRVTAAPYVRNQLGVYNFKRRASISVRQAE